MRAQRTIPARFALTMALTAAAMLAGCIPIDPGGGGSTPAGKGLVPFADQLDFVSYFRTAYNGSNRGTGFFDSFLQPTVALAEGAPAGGDGSSFTTTNIQEAGVDEADTIETDGRYFYVVSGSTLRIIEIAADGGLSQVGQWDSDLPLSSLYLTGERVIVLAQNYASSGGPEILIYPPYHVGSGVTVVELDVSDPAAPAETGRIALDGNLVASRLTSDRLIVVLSIVPDVAALGPLVQLTTNPDDLNPTVQVNGQTRTMVSWEHWLRPEDPNGWYSTAIVTLDAADITQMTHATAVLASAGTIYASRDALYLTDTDYAPDGSYRETTNIHKFALSASGEAVYAGSGQVTGRLLNQYSLGEFEGALRVAAHVPAAAVLIDGGGIAVGSSGGVDAVPPDTAVSNAQSVDLSAAASNSVYVLQASDGELVVSGRIDGIAPGETLYSARFIGTRGYLVTFRQIDPLFTLDLADPAAPRLVGELKVPGFSDYLHPFGDDLLIGVGRATQIGPFGGTIAGGVQLSLFDVSDPANPTAVQQLTLGGPGSAADVSSDPKAFAMLADRGALALPMQLYSTSGNYAPLFDGVQFYKVSATGFTALGQLPSLNPAPSDERFYYYGALWRRGAINGDFGFALTPDGIRSAHLADFSQTHEISLGP